MTRPASKPGHVWDRYVEEPLCALVGVLPVVQSMRMSNFSTSCNQLGVACTFWSRSTRMSRNHHSKCRGNLVIAKFLGPPALITDGSPLGNPWRVVQGTTSRKYVPPSWLNAVLESTAFFAARDEAPLRHIIVRAGATLKLDTRAS